MDTVVAKERPILFSSPMGRALLAGTKMQTLRVVKPQPPAEVEALYSCNIVAHEMEDADGRHQGYGFQDEDMNCWRCPYGQPGDRLWVRESFATYEGGTPIYKADSDYLPQTNMRWRPSIHMPRAASRLLLEITAVRVERVQAISEADAVAEGIQPYYFYPSNACERASVQPPKGDGEKLQLGWANYYPKGDECRYLPAADSYRTLWQSINGPESWAANPWVWVVEFKVVEGKEPSRA